MIQHFGQYSRWHHADEPVYGIDGLESMTTLSYLAKTKNIDRIKKYLKKVSVNSCPAFLGKWDEDAVQSLPFLDPSVSCRFLDICGIPG